mgnify:FL=1|jgi:hypothetical protein
MINIEECSKGDVCWVLLPLVQKAPMYGTISDIYKLENAIQVLTLNYGIRVVRIEDAFWSEIEAKKVKKKKK